MPNQRPICQQWVSCIWRFHPRMRNNIVAILNNTSGLRKTFLLPSWYMESPRSRPQCSEMGRCHCGNHSAVQLLHFHLQHSAVRLLRNYGDNYAVSLWDCLIIGPLRNNTCPQQEKRRQFIIWGPQYLPRKQKIRTKKCERNQQKLGFTSSFTSNQNTRDQK